MSLFTLNLYFHSSISRCLEISQFLDINSGINDFQDIRVLYFSGKGSTHCVLSSVLAYIVDFPSS